jgi:NAD(P)-dependent dehydrogenase (short-subunit alcohol dehydrogenase family)
MALALGAAVAMSFAWRAKRGEIGATVAEIQQQGGQATALACDVNRRESVDQVVETVVEQTKRFGHSGQQRRDHAGYVVAGHV